MSEVALFVDLENITQSLWKRFQQSPDPFDWVEKAKKYGPLSFARAYGDFSQAHLARLEGDLRAAGIDKYDCPTKQRGTDSQSTVDAHIIIDLFEVAIDRPGTKTFVLFAGDSDYTRVVTRLRNRLDKDVIVAGVPGSISRDLARAATAVDALEPVAEGPVNEAGLIRLVDRYEQTLREGVRPTFGRLLAYVSDPRNSDVVGSQVAQNTLNEMVEAGILRQYQEQLPDGRALRVTELARDHPEVVAAVGEG